MELKEENRILKIKLADLEVENHKLKEENKIIIELYKELANEKG